MLMELTVIPLARGRSLSSDLAELIGLIDESGLPYKVTEFGTVVEGPWEELMAIAKICHVAIRKKTDRVLILIRLDDYGDRTYPRQSPTSSSTSGDKFGNRPLPPITPGCGCHRRSPAAWPRPALKYARPRALGWQLLGLLCAAEYERFIDSGRRSSKTKAYGAGRNP